MSSYCAQCKCCLAQAGFTLCYFCEDGVPCPNKKKQIGNIGAEAIQGATVPTATENGRPRSNEERRSVPAAAAASSDGSGWIEERDRYREKRKKKGHSKELQRAIEGVPPSASATPPVVPIDLEDVIADLGARGFSLGRAETVVYDLAFKQNYSSSKDLLRDALAKLAAPLDTSDLDASSSVPQISKALTPGRDRRHARASGVLRRESTEALGGNHGAAQVTKKSPAPSPKKTSSTEKRMDMKKCRHPECKTLIMQHNKSGCCPKHFHWGSKNPISLNSAKPQASPPRNSDSSKSENSRGEAVATICVTEKHLDAFWQKLTLDEKAEIFTSQLLSANQG